MEKNNILEKWSPSVEAVEHYLRKWDNLPNYVAQENALDKLFLTLCQHNLDMNDILIKSSTLNDFYSTNIFNIFKVAEHYHSINIDERLDAGDLTLVDELSIVPIDGKVYHFYSFATKYCSHHRPEVYPIYDSYVEKLLTFFRNRDHFHSFKTKDLRNYMIYNEVINSFKGFYKLEQYTVKQIDKYLWQLGKEAFPKSYR